MRILKGILASRGITIGPAFHFKRASLDFDQCTVDDPAAEVKLFEAALATGLEQLQAVKAKAASES